MKAGGLALCVRLRRLCPAMAPHLPDAGERFGVLDEYQPPPAARPRGASIAGLHQQQQQRFEAPPPLQGFGSEAAAGGGGGSRGLLPEGLPEDVDLEEQRMLMAALTGGEYAGPPPGGMGGGRPPVPAPCPTHSCFSEDKR